MTLYDKIGEALLPLIQEQYSDAVRVIEWCDTAGLFGCETCASAEVEVEATFRKADGGTGYWTHDGSLSGLLQKLDKKSQESQAS